MRSILTKSHPVTYVFDFIGKKRRNLFKHAKETISSEEGWSKRGSKVPILKEVNFGKVKLWDVEHFFNIFVIKVRFYTM